MSAHQKAAEVYKDQNTPIARDDVAPWITLLPSTPESVARLRCTRCRTVDHLMYGISIDAMSRLIKRFYTRHRQCTGTNPRHK